MRERAGGTYRSEQRGGLAGGGTAPEVNTDGTLTQKAEHRTREREGQRDEQEWVAGGLGGDLVLPVVESSRLREAMGLGPGAQ